MLQNEAETGIDDESRTRSSRATPEKIYEKAKREPDYRFYTLYHKVCWMETLHRAYRQAKVNAGAAGVDGIRFKDMKHRHSGESRRQQRLPRPTATAPAADSILGGGCLSDVSATCR